MTTKATSIKTAAVPVGFLHTLILALVFAPTALVVFLIAGTPAVALFYSQAVLTLVALLVGLVFAGATTSILALGIALAGLFNYDGMGWKRVSFLTMLWSVSVITIYSVATGNPWVAVITGFVAVANWWVIQGTLFSRFAKAGRNGAQLQTDLATALLDYFAPSSDFRVKPKGAQLVAEAYIDEKARMTKTLSHITRVEQVEPDVFKVDIRNNVVGKTDEKLLKELEATASTLGFYDWESVDEDPRAGFVTITVWLTERRDATSTVSGMLMWTQGDKQ